MLGHDGRACKLAGNEGVEVVAQLAGQMLLPVNIVHGLDGHRMQLLVTIVVPGATVAAIVQPDPAELGV
ncbi:hypothetical protein D3C76_1504100 [compost metagenome]